jgi:hypothetical protein
MTAPKSTPESIASQLAGVWKLLSYKVEHEGREDSFPFGPQPHSAGSSWTRGERFSSTSVIQSRILSIATAHIFDPLLAIDRSHPHPRINDSKSALIRSACVVGIAEMNTSSHSLPRTAKQEIPHLG